MPLQARRHVAQRPAIDVLGLSRSASGTARKAPRTMSSSLLDHARKLGSREAGLAVVVTHRSDGTAQASVVNAGVLDHPVTGTPAIGFVVQGGARKKLANLRARPMTTVV